MIESCKKRKHCRPLTPGRNRFENDTLDQSLPFFFDIPLSCRILVDSSACLDLLDSVVSDAQILGIDTETRPAIYKSASKGKNKTALVQICTRSDRGNEMVFIVDMIALDKLNLLMTLDKALGPVLADDNVVKLGHGLAYDFKELQESYPDMKAFYTIENILDTTKMYKKLRPNEKNNISLKKLTKMFLHLNLIKSQTCSDWELRPLSESQLHYCACDALVLLRLYDAMTFDALDVFGNQSFEDIAFSVVSTKNASDYSAEEVRAKAHCMTFDAASDSFSSSCVESESDDLDSLSRDNLVPTSTNK